MFNFLQFIKDKLDLLEIKLMMTLLFYLHFKLNLSLKCK